MISHYKPQITVKHSSLYLFANKLPLPFVHVILSIKRNVDGTSQLYRRFCFQLNSSRWCSIRYVIHVFILYRYKCSLLCISLKCISVITKQTYLILSISIKFDRHRYSNFKSLDLTITKRLF